MVTTENQRTGQKSHLFQQFWVQIEVSSQSSRHNFIEHLTHKNEGLTA